MLALSCSRHTSSPSGVSALSGQWKSECLDLGEGLHHGVSIEIKYTFKEEDIFEKQIIQHAGDDCGAPITSELQTGQYFLSDLAGKNDTWKLDLIYEKVTLSVFASNTAKNYETSKFCGVENWTVDKPSTVTGKTCGLIDKPQKGEEFFDIVKKKDEKTLQFGLVDSSKNGKSEKRRPIKIDDASSYARTEL